MTRAQQKKKQLKTVTTEPSFILKPDSKHRQYKIQMLDGITRIVRKQIRSEQDLIKEIEKIGEKNIKNIYESASTFLDPLNVRGFNSPYQPILLDNMLFIDIDKKGVEEVKKALFFMGQYSDYQLWKIVQSSPESFHIYYQDSNKTFLTDHPRKRIEFMVKRRKEIEDALIKAGIQLDKGITSDIWRVSRVIGSKNKNKNGFVCRDVTRELLFTGQVIDTSSSTAKRACPNQDKNMTISSLKSSSFLRVARHEKYPASESRKAMTNTTPSENQRQSRPEVRDPLFYFFRFTTNMVYGLKEQYVPYIEIDKERNYERLVKLLQEKYNIGTIYVFETDTKYCLLGLKIFDERRIQKIMRFSNACNLNTFLKYKHSWIKLSDCIYEDRVVPLNFIDRIQQDVKGVFSSPHAELIKKRIGTEKMESFAGTENPIMIAKMELRNIANGS
jgi:hypothetical protein